MRKIIVRADDLGFSEGVNHGIAKTVKDGVVRSVGLMTNMPDAEHGLELMKDCEVCYGLHTNICVGHSLMDPACIPSLVNEKGEFKSSKDFRNTKEDFVVLEEVILEIEAQYERFIELVGHKPSYFEGHAIASDNFFRGLEIVAERHQCDYLPMRVEEPIPFKRGLLYVTMPEPGEEPMALFKRASTNIHEDGAIEMCVCHPGYIDSYLYRHSSMTVQRVMEAEMLCSDGLKQWIREQNLKVVTYDEL